MPDRGSPVRRHPRRLRLPASPARRVDVSGVDAFHPGGQPASRIKRRARDERAVSRGTRSRSRAVNTHASPVLSIALGARRIRLAGRRSWIARLWRLEEEIAAEPPVEGQLRATDPWGACAGGEVAQVGTQCDDEGSARLGTYFRASPARGPSAEGRTPRSWSIPILFSSLSVGWYLPKHMAQRALHRPKHKAVRRWPTARAQILESGSDRQAPHCHCGQRPTCTWTNISSRLRPSVPSLTGRRRIASGGSCSTKSPIWITTSMRRAHYACQSAGCVKTIACHVHSALRRITASTTCSDRPEPIPRMRALHRTVSNLIAVDT